MKKFIIMAAALVLSAVSFTSCESDPIVPVLSGETEFTVRQGESLTIKPIYTSVLDGATFTWTDGENNVLATTQELTLENKELGDHNYKLTISNSSKASETASQHYRVTVEKYTVTLDFEGDYWTTKIDDKQYGGQMLYSGEGYSWTCMNTNITSQLTNGYGDNKFWGGGIAISNYIDADIQNHNTYTYQLAVPESNGSKNFAVAYCDASFTFADGKARYIESMQICPTTYTLGVCKYGDGYAASLANGGDLILEITAILEDGTEKKGTDHIYFAHGGTLMTKWVTFPMSNYYGNCKVKGLKFHMTGTDTSDYGGIKTPTYFAFDNVVVDMYAE